MKNKTVLITGGTSGIGRAAAFAFGKRGAFVIIASRIAENGKKVEAELREADIDARWLRVDVSDSGEIENLFSIIKEEYGGIDYAFNNAISDGNTDWLENLNEDDWNKTIQGILTSTFLCMKYELQLMVKNRSGAIVNNSSVDGLRGFGFSPAYCAAKHGVIGLTKAAAIQYAQKGIRINAVCPGWTMTPPVEEMIRQDPGQAEGMIYHQPIGRFGKPEEIAEAVVWLCSDNSSFVLGTALSVDGGYTIV